MTKPVRPISLILTVLNEERAMQEFLQSIHTLTVYPAEVVVVDGGSRDETVKLLKSWIPPEGVTLRLEITPGANISEGRNQAILLAAHEFIAVSDAGTSLNAEWLEALYASLENGADVASGFFTSGGDKFWTKTIGAVITPHLKEIDPTTFLPSSRSVAYRKSAWESAGGYPEWLDYCEDLVFDMKLKEQQSSFDFVPSAIATWDARPTLIAFAKQYFRYARGDGKAGLWAKRHLARYGAYLAGIAFAILAFVWPWLWALLGALAAVYLSKFFTRVIRARASLAASTIGAFLLVPLIVITGDVSKMIGYPFGVRWKRNQRGQATTA